MTVGEKLRKAREDAKLTHTQAYAKIKEQGGDNFDLEFKSFSKGRLNDFETDKMLHELTPALAKLIAKALGMDATALVV